MVRRVWLALLAMSMLTGVVVKALETEAFDAVEAELLARAALLGEDLDKDGKKLKKTYDKALKSFAKPSSSRKTDAKGIGKIAKLLLKAFPEDVALQALVAQGVQSFLDETAAELAWLTDSLALVEPDNSQLGKAHDWLDKANALLAAALQQPSVAQRIRALSKVQSAADKARSYAFRAFAEDDIEPPPPAFDHAKHFTQNAYEGTSSCLACHASIGDDILTTGHWTWEGAATGVEGHEDHSHGKRDLINNFCIAIASNEPRCTQCHIGVGYANDSFDFSDPNGIDCLVCHDQTDTYAKAPKTAGSPADGVDLQAVACSVGEREGVPSRRACGMCHFNAGGGDNVKHGDLSTDMLATTREYDVHMGTDGGNFACVECHRVQRDVKGDMVSHGIGGMPTHSQDEGAMRQCSDCHTTNPHPEGSSIRSIVTAHPRLACQVCHIPAIARKNATKVEWYWETAGDAGRVPVIDPETGKPDYDKMKGDFVWSKNVAPTLKWFNGKWKRTFMNDNETFTTTPVVLAAPLGSAADASAMIYPFKKMIGSQVADSVNNSVMVPHLFGLGAGPNPYWAAYDWDLAIQEGAAYTGQTYSGSYGFVDTTMYLTVNHEVAPKEQALGYGGSCADCHTVGVIDWSELGRTNPMPMDP